MDPIYIAYSLPLWAHTGPVGRRKKNDFLPLNFLGAAGKPFLRITGTFNPSDIFITNANASRPADPPSCIMHFLWFVLIFLFEGWFSISLFQAGGEEKKGKNRGIQKPIFEIPFFSLIFLWCLWGYNTLSGICLVFYSISPFQNVRGVCFFPPSPPFPTIYGPDYYSLIHFNFKQTTQNKHVDEFFYLLKGSKIKK